MPMSDNNYRRCSLATVARPIEVDSVLINPRGLDDFLRAEGLLPRKQGLVHQREPIVRPRITVGCAAVKGCTCKAYPDWH